MGSERNTQVITYEKHEIGSELVDQFGKKFGRFSARGWKTRDEGAASREGDWWCDVDSVIFMWGKMQWRSNDSAE